MCTIFIMCINYFCTALTADGMYFLMCELFSLHLPRLVFSLFASLRFTFPFIFFKPFCSPLICTSSSFACLLDRAPETKGRVLPFPQWLLKTPLVHLLPSHLILLFYPSRALLPITLLLILRTAGSSPSRVFSILKLNF